MATKKALKKPSKKVLKKNNISKKKYGPRAQKKIEAVIEEFAAGELHSGRSKKPVKSREQAIAIGISEARKRGFKVPKRKKSPSL